MVNRAHFMLRWSTVALVLCGYWSLTAVPGISVLILLPPILIVACMRGAEHLHATYPAYNIVTRALTLAYLCFLPLTVLSLGVLPAVTILVAFIQVYTLLHRKETKNFYHLHLMSLFLLLAACVQQPEPIIGVIMLVFLVSAVWAGLALRITAEMSNTAMLNEPEIIALDKLDHQAVHGQTGSRGGSIVLVATGLSIVTVGVTVLFFLFTPRIEAGLLGRSQQVEERTGLSETVDLTSGSSIQEDTTPVMIIRFPDEPDGRVANTNWLYWRVSTLGKYADNGWQELAGELFDPGISHSGPYVTNQGIGGRGANKEVTRTRRPDRKLVRQLIYMDTIPTENIPAMHLVQRVRLTGQTKGTTLRWENLGDLTVVLNRPQSRNQLEFEAWSEPAASSAEALRAAPVFTYEPGDTTANRFMSYDLSPETRVLVDSITADATNPYDKAIAIQNYLSGPNYLYTLNIPEMDSDSVIDAFINEVRMGHCELFGTAMALMLRTQGIPTRVVLGYRGGEFSPSDSVYTIRANMAHLWVEAWFPGEGWVIFDPSPQANDAPPTGVQRLGLSFSRSILRAKMFWFQEVVAFSGTTELQRLKEFSLGIFRDASDNSSENEAGGGGRRTGVQTGGGILDIFIFLPMAGVVLWLLFRKRRKPTTTSFQLSRDQTQVIRLYMALRRKLQKYGVDCRGKTAEEVGILVHEITWEDGAAATDVLALYNKVRFGSDVLDRTELATLKQRLKSFRPGVPAPTGSE